MTSLADDLTTAATRFFIVRETVPLTWDQPPAWLINDRLVVLDPIGRGGELADCMPLLSSQ